jgi:putative ABC transport system permease protein
MKRAVKRMFNILKIAWRNLMRYRRRTILTATLITVGIIAVLLFVAIAGSFKSMMVGQITDSMLGHLQVHKKGYVASIDSLPLSMNMNEKQIAAIEDVLDSNPMVEAYTKRIKFGAGFSNFTETTNIRLNAVDPELEIIACPLLPSRVIEGDISETLIKEKHILVPELLAKGMNIKVDDEIVLVATNQDGSVNGLTFIVQGILESISGPGGRDGYIHIDDARRLLRIETEEVMEIAVLLKSPDMLDDAVAKINGALGEMKNEKGLPVLEVHTWEKLSPFFNIAQMIDLMTLFIKIMLVAIVLISIMNVMLMAVYERIKEIGTISAMGTLPSKILALFVTEGLLLGLLGAAIGTAISLVIIYVMNIVKVPFAFGRQQNLMLEPSIGVSDVIIICIVVVLVAVIATLQPAWKASRMDPMTALRHV